MAKKPYIKPVLARHQAGVANKFATASAARYKDSIDGVEVGELVRRFGSPVFVYSHRGLKEKYQAAQRAFSTRYPKVQFAWSYKTNYLAAVCRAFHRMGSWAEVVSGFEYDMARSYGVPGDRIIYNGPSKSPESLRRAIAEGALVNIDGYDEIPELEAIAAELGHPIQFGARVNMSITGFAAWDRFGLNIDSGEAYHTIKRALRSGKLELAGLHTHIGTFVLEPRFYGEAARKMIELARLLRKDLGVHLKYIDMGGGFASRSRLKGSYVPTDQVVPDVEGYAEAICSPLLAAFPPDELPLLFLETGRALVDEAGSLISTVVATKRLPSGTRSLVLDAGVNLLFTAFWYDLDILPTADKGPDSEIHSVYGPLCMQIDVVGESLRMPYLEKGDTVVVRPVGAYNNTQWMQFIQLRPAVVMIGEAGEAALIRSPETLDHVTRLDVVPSWLE
jgi:diaminopimelate decarboxylase